MAAIEAATARGVRINATVSFSASTVASTAVAASAPAASIHWRRSRARRNTGCIDVITGDSAFLFHTSELETAVRKNLLAPEIGDAHQRYPFERARLVVEQTDAC